MANTNYITSSVQNGYGKSFIATGKFPIVAKRAWQTYADALEYAGDLADSCFAGAILAVINDTDAKKNGVYLVESCPTLQNPDAEIILTKVGDGSGSEAVANYAAAVAAATSDNLGQILYVINPTYKKGEGTTLNPDEADADEEGNKIVVYTAGPYIVTGSGAVAKLGTTSATGDIAGDVENLKGRMSTAEGEIDALQTAVGDANSGLVKDLADANDAIDAVEGRMDTAEGEIDALQEAVGNTESGLVKDVAALQTLTGEHTETLSGYGERIGANETAVTELRNAVAGGVHFRGVREELPWEDVITIDGDGSVYLDGYNVGDIIMVVSNSFNVDEPTKEYILTEGEFTIELGEGPDGEPETAMEHGYRWIELGDVSVSDQKIAELEKDFDDHVKAMKTAWSEHLEEADGKYATIANLEAAEQAAEKALEDHVAAMASTIANAADYAANKGSFALAANVVANKTFNQHVSDAGTRMDGIDAAILAIPVKNVADDTVLKLSDTGELSVDMSNFVTKDGDKVLSTNDFTNELKAKLDGVATDAQVNVIETVKVNGGVITVAEDKSVNIDMVAHLAAKLSVNGNILTESNGVLTAVVDAADINLSSDIGSHTAANTTVQDMLKNVYDIANTKIGTLHIASGASANVLALSKTDIANDTIELKIASGSAITATANGLDLVWTEL